MFLLFVVVDHCEGLSYSSHRYSIVKIILSNNFAGSLLRIMSCLLYLLVLVSFHGECLTTTCLAICKDGGVIALNYLADEAVYLKLVKDVLLRTGLVEDLVKHVILPGAVVRLFNLNLVLTSVNAEQVRLMVLFFFILQQWSYPDCNPNIRWHYFSIN